MKKCRTCGLVKPAQDFYFAKRKTKSRQRQTECKDCTGWRKRLRVYGISKAEYLTLLDEQSGVCAICLTDEDEKMLAVDHDHATGEVRGLLCAKCNKGLGLLRDDPAILRSALEYLTDR